MSSPFLQSATPALARPSPDQQHPLTDQERDEMDIDVPPPPRPPSGHPAREGDDDGLPDDMAGSRESAMTDAEIDDLIASAKDESAHALSMLSSLQTGRDPEQPDPVLQLPLMIHTLHAELQNSEPRPHDLTLLQFLDHSFPFYEFSPGTAAADLAELHKAADFLGDQAHDHRAYAKYLHAISDKENPEWAEEHDARESEHASRAAEEVVNLNRRDLEFLGGDIAELAQELENGELSLDASIANLSALLSTYDALPDPLVHFPDSSIDEQSALLQKMHHERVQIQSDLDDLEPAVAAGPARLADLQRELDALEAENAQLEKEADAEGEALRQVQERHKGMSPEVARAVRGRRNMVSCVSRVSGVVKVTPVALGPVAHVGGGDQQEGEARDRMLVEGVLGAQAHRTYSAPALVLDLLDVRDSELSQAMGDAAVLYRRKAIVAESLETRDLHVFLVLVPRDDADLDAFSLPLLLSSTRIPQPATVRVEDPSVTRAVANTPQHLTRAHLTLHHLSKRANALLARDALVAYLEQVGGYVCHVLRDEKRESGTRTPPWEIVVGTRDGSPARMVLSVSRDSGRVVRFAVHGPGAWSSDKQLRLTELGQQASSSMEGVLALVQAVFQ